MNTGIDVVVGAGDRIDELPRELWLLGGDGSAVPGAVFVPDAEGSRAVLLTRDLRSTRALAVTVEQGPDGAAAPSRAPRLSGRLPD